MAFLFLFIFFLISDYATAEEIKFETFPDEYNLPPSKNKKITEIDNLLSDNITLKSIPRTNISDLDKNLLKEKNPFYL